MNDTGSLIFYLAALVLPLAALLARRPNLGQTVRMALAWAAIFAVAALVFANRDRFDPAVAAVRGAFGGEQRASGDTVRLRIAPDGHFYATVSLNGVRRRMLIDSGATTTALSSRTARAAKLEPSSPLPVQLRTANGDIEAARVRIARLQVGPITQRGLPAVTAAAFGDLDVLGMNFLSGLKRWGVEEGVLVLTP